MLTRILVPVEFSPRCQGAIQYAAALARHFHSEIALIHVVLPPAAVYGFSEAAAYTTVPDLQAEVVADRKARLNTFGAAELQDLPVTRTVLEGDPAHTIVRYAHQFGAQLIVMPTHAYGPFRRFLLGSVTAKVIHDAGCPVWTSPHLELARVPDLVGLRRVLCAVDLGIDSRATLAWAACFAREHGSKLATLHAIPMSSTRLGGVYFDPDWSIHMATDARRIISELQADLEIAGEAIVVVGEAPQAIAETAAEWKADLVVIGRGRPGRVLGRLRTNAYAILRESPCPVVAV
ncbi:MAG TPA: universal stress protein [Candidatus Sulfopaludibacter sp.]|jgi:nucleotide-binding universal stress UspA family protein|nr:universal stress protein [Candidatus Sulfopaludibacter sp.]